MRRVFTERVRATSKTAIAFFFVFFFFQCGSQQINLTTQLSPPIKTKQPKAGNQASCLIHVQQGGFGERPFHPVTRNRGVGQKASPSKAQRPAFRLLLHCEGFFSPALIFLDLSQEGVGGGAGSLSVNQRGPVVCRRPASVATVAAPSPTAEVWASHLVPLPHPDAMISLPTSFHPSNPPASSEYAYPLACPTWTSVQTPVTSF